MRQMLNTALRAFGRRRPRPPRAGSRAEAELARLRAALALAEAALWEYDPATRTMTLIETGGDVVFGRSREEWADRELRHAVRHPDDVPLRRAAIARLLAGELEQVEYESRVRDEDGGWRRLRNTATLAPEPGRPQLIRGVTVDVTAQRLHEDLHRTLFDATAVGIAVLDAGRRIVDANSALCAILGRPKEALVVRPLSELAFAPSSTALAPAPARPGAAAEASATVEERYRRADGTPVWVRTTVSPIGRTPGLSVAVVEDLTERDRAEAQLREQTSLLTRAQRIGGVGSWVYYPDGDRDEWSPETRRIFGVGDDEPTLGDPSLFHSIVHPEDRERVEHATAAAAFAAGLPPELEYRIVRRSDGEVRWIRQQADVEFRPDGTPWRTVGVVMDVTDRRRAEEELREQSALLERAQEVGRLGSFAIDARTRRVRASRGLARVLRVPGDGFETSLEEFRRRFAHEDDHAAWTASADARIEIPGPYTSRRHARCVDGTPIWIDVHGEVETDADGVPVRVVGVIQDVTAREEAEAALREKTSLLERAQEVAKIGSFVVDVRESSFQWSPMLTTLLCEDEGRTVGSIAEFRARYVVEEDLPRWTATMERAYRDGGAFTIEARLRRANGSLMWAQLHGTVELDAHGEPVRALGVIQDVTDQHRLGEQLRQAQKLDAVGQLAGGIAHDFNNLLTVIAGNALLAVDGGDPEATREGMREILRASEGASELVRRLLAFSREEVSEPRRVDLNVAVEAVRRLLARLIEEHIAVEADLDSGEAPILADPVELEQVLLNLAVNARDAMPAGGRLAIRTRADEEAVTLTVADSGVGMDDRTRERIFDPFFTTKPRGQGTGLGLATVYGIVTKGGGEIEVDSTPGKGATFTIRWPRAGAEEPSGSVAGPLAIVPGAGERILIVEDEPMVLTIAAELLGRAGYAIATAENGEEALRLVEGGERFDLVVSDLMMPKLTGIQLTDELRARGIRLPTVYTSGYPQGVAPPSGEPDPLVTFVGKPYSGETLTAAVRRQLDLAAGRAGGG